MKYQCLMIDDDRVIAETTAEYFNMFDISTAYVTGYDEAVAFLAEHEVSLLLLDINLGDKSGFELCKNVRKNYDMPILFISARSSDDDVLTALNIGGDDYIQKPYTLNILLAKVRAILNRYEKSIKTEDTAAEASDRIRINNETVLDTNLHKLRKGDELISLKAMEYKLLNHLLRNKNRVVTKDELLSEVWNDPFISEGTLAVHIRHLREKIETDPNDPQVIKTVWGVGYLIEEWCDHETL